MEDYPPTKQDTEEQINEFLNDLKTGFTKKKEHKQQHSKKKEGEDD